jgi:hypothetical protein
MKPLDSETRVLSRVAPRPLILARRSQAPSRLRHRAPAAKQINKPPRARRRVLAEAAARPRPRAPPPPRRAQPGTMHFRPYRPPCVSCYSVGCESPDDDKIAIDLEACRLYDAGEIDELFDASCSRSPVRKQRSRLGGYGRFRCVNQFRVVARHHRDPHRSPRGGPLRGHRRDPRHRLPPRSPDRREAPDRRDFARDRCDGYFC